MSLIRVARGMMRGDTAVIDYVVRVNPTTGLPTLEVVGSPQNLAGCKVWFTAKNNAVVQDSQAIFQRTSDPANGVVFTSPAEGKLRVTIVPDNTRFQPDGPTKLVYDLQILTVGGSVVTLEVGDLTVTPDVTRSIV